MYTEKWEEIVPHLNPRCVKAYCLSFQMGFHKLLQEAIAQAGRPRHDLPLVTIMRTMLGYPEARPGGPTAMDINTVIEHCKTQSFDDMEKIIAKAWEDAACDSPEVVGILGDGQTIMRSPLPPPSPPPPSPPHMHALPPPRVRPPDRPARAPGDTGLRDEFRHRPFVSSRRKTFLIIGPFHQHAHFLLIMTCAWYSCLLSFCCAALQIKKVLPTAMDLEKANYEHHFSLHRVVTVAIYAYLLQDVVRPPVSMFLESPDAFQSHVNHAGGIVLLNYLRMAGIPGLQFQRSARAGQGEDFWKLYALMFHAARVFQNRPNIRQISLLGVVSFICVFPKLRPVVAAYCAVSLLNRASRPPTCATPLML